MDSFSEIWQRSADNPLFFVALIAWSSISVGGLFCVGWRVFDALMDAVSSFISWCFKRLITRKKKP